MAGFSWSWAWGPAHLHGLKWETKKYLSHCIKLSQTHVSRTKKNIKGLVGGPLLVGDLGPRPLPPQIRPCSRVCCSGWNPGLLIV